MKNFPHQYNDLRKLRATLATLRDLLNSGHDPGDDAILGYELARRAIYRFRHLDYEGEDSAVHQRVERRISEELEKPGSRQGARTAAREMRRTLRYLGWVEGEGTDLTRQGEAVLSTSEGSDAEREMIQEALVAMPLADSAGRISHPVQILLRLVAELAFTSRKGMEVVLEAQDDSASEFQRIRELASLPDEQRKARLRSLGWTDSQLANALKILPSFAKQAGLITQTATGTYILTQAGERLLQHPRVSISSTPESQDSAPHRRRRSAVVQTRSTSEVGAARHLSPSERRILNDAQQQTAAELLYERTARHQLLVQALARRCRPASFYEDPMGYDLLIDSGGDQPLVLVEAKTVDGDGHAQTRRALGQLLYYEDFQVRIAFPNRQVRRLVIVDSDLPPELAAFLQKYSVGLLVYRDGGFQPANDAGELLATQILSPAGSSSP